MSGGCQVDNLPYPLSVPFVPLVLFAPFRQPCQPTDLFPNIYTRVCAYVYILYKKVGWLASRLLGLRVMWNV